MTEKQQSSRPFSAQPAGRQLFLPQTLLLTWPTGRPPCRGLAPSEWGGPGRTNHCRGIAAAGLDGSGFAAPAQECSGQVGNGGPSATGDNLAGEVDRGASAIRNLQGGQPQSARMDEEPSGERRQSPFSSIRIRRILGVESEQIYGLALLSVIHIILFFRTFRLFLSKTEQLASLIPTNQIPFGKWHGLSTARFFHTSS